MDNYPDRIEGTNLLRMAVAGHDLTQREALRLAVYVMPSLVGVAGERVMTANVWQATRAALAKAAE
jgi:hypothetical protein